MGYRSIMSEDSLTIITTNDFRAPSNQTETRTTYPPTASKTVLTVSTTSISTPRLLGIFTWSKGVSKHSMDRVDSAIRPQKLIYCAHSIQWHLQASAEKSLPFSGFLNLVYSIWQEQEGWGGGGSTRRKASASTEQYNHSRNRDMRSSAIK